MRGLHRLPRISPARCPYYTKWAESSSSAMQADAREISVDLMNRGGSSGKARCSAPGFAIWMRFSGVMTSW